MPIRPENRARYPSDWRAISTQIRAGRAHWRCECDGRCASTSCPGTPGSPCRAINGQPSATTGKKVVLTVAHLDHIPENCDPANLLAMCQRCHLAYDREHHAETAAATRAAALAAQMEPMF